MNYPDLKDGVFLSFKINDVIDQNIPRYQQYKDISVPDQNLIVINLNEPDQDLIEVFDETERVYDINIVSSEFQVIDLLDDSVVDLLIINNFDDDIEENMNVLNTVKDLFQALNV